MEVRLVVTLVALMLFSISNRGYACNLADLSVTSTKVPGQTGWDPLTLVTVKNRCNCMQTNVKLDCPGFNSFVRVIPPGIVTAVGDNRHCTLNVPVKNDDVAKFYYSSSTHIIFAPVSSNISCFVA